MTEPTTPRLAPLGMWFEEFEPGARFVTPARTVTEADVVIYCGLSGDYNPLHTDEEFAKGTQFGTRIAAGLMGRMILSGLLTRLGILEGTVIANLELSEWRFTGPILIGDTIHGEIQVAEKRLTSNPTRGVVSFTMAIKNQRDEEVQRGIQKMMVSTRPSGQSQSATDSEVA